jgi:protein-disulfide isomerase
MITRLLYKENLLVLLVFSILFISVGAININYYVEGSTQESNDKENVLSLQNLIENGSPFQGNITAPITIIDFSDFQCYLCNRFVKNTEPLLNETYIQTGNAALVFKHLPNRGFDSLDGALAAQCTAEQDKFWQFHNLLYSNQGPIDSGWVNKDNLKKFASQISGLNIKQFDSCFNSEKYKTFIQNDINLASSFGFRETPSFIIVNSDGSDPQLLSGALPFPSFEAVINMRLGM